MDALGATLNLHDMHPRKEVDRGLRLDSIIVEFLDFVIESDNRFIYNS